MNFNLHWTDNLGLGYLRVAGQRLAQVQEPRPAVYDCDYFRLPGLIIRRRLFSIEAVKVLIAHVLYECLQPRTLCLRFCELPEEFSMGFSVDLENGRTVRFPLVSIIESAKC